MDELESRDDQDHIAIVGMAGRFPGAKNVDEFWENLRDGVESITFFTDGDSLAAGVDPELLKKPDFVRAHGVLDDIEMFDAPFFDMTPRDAKFLDPQHRLFLECAWDALENAGYDSEAYKGRIGVFAGTSFSTYLLRNILPNNMVCFPTSDRLEMALTNHKDTMPMRVSFHMNLTGPSISLGTTCSTSLVAVHLGCQSLLTYQSDMVMAGASFVRIPPKEGYLFQDGMIYSPDGHIRTFDARAKGIVAGAGMGIVVLKRLEEAIKDGDFIHAVIRASAINNDGSTKIGYTAPSVEGQAEVISEAISFAGIDSDTISYVEAHGTGTELGDPAEMASLIRAFRTTASDSRTLKKEFCAVGSAKPNIGHLNHASGMAGLIKTVMALKHRQLPPSINFEKPNPKIDFANSPFYVNTTLQEWQSNGTPRRAGVNAFGIGGTNAHVVLEEPPAQEPLEKFRPWQLMVISAKTGSALKTATGNLTEYLKQHPQLNLSDVAYTLQTGRRAFNHRRILICQDNDDINTVLKTQDQKRIFTAFRKSEVPVAFMFSGQGAQYVNMARELYRVEPTFQVQVDRCSEILKPHLGFNLGQLLYSNEADTEEAARKLEQTRITQPALFVVEYALAKLWMEWGVHPRAMIGHSIGEYVAACLAGVFSLKDALSLVAVRGEMMQEMPPGTMLAISLPFQEVQPLLGDELCLAVINGPSLCVVAGPPHATEALQQHLNEKDVMWRPLHTSHAFHSKMMDPIVEPFTLQVKKIPLNPPKIPYVSNVTGTWITDEEATEPAYWSRHLRQTVHFSDGLKLLLQEEERILLEVGPGRILSSLAKQHPDKSPRQVVLTSVRHPQATQSDVAFLLTTLGKLWLAGAKVDWSGFYAHERRLRTPLPTYPFECKPYWIGAPKSTPSALSTFQLPQDEKTKEGLAEEDLVEEESHLFLQPGLSSHAAPRNRKEEKIAAVWKEVMGVEQVGIHDDFFEMGGSSLIAIKVVAGICKALKTDLSVRNFLTAPTIAEVAELIELTVSTKKARNIQDTRNIPDSKKSSSFTSSLVRLRAGNARNKPLFLVHPMDGHVYLYRDLAYCLDSERPVYGFQAPGLEGEAEPFTRVQEMATHYIKAMVSIQQDGPYLLGGGSFGGIVAFEMAQQLLALGRRTEFLFLIDTPAIGGQALFNLKDDNAVLAFIVEHLLKLEMDSGFFNELREFSLEEQIARISEQSKNHEQSLGFEPSRIIDLVRIVRANNGAMNSYCPTVYPGRFTFFRAREPWKNNKPHHPEYFWTDFAGEGIEINPVPGNHITMNYEPHVRVIAERLESSFRSI